jgi:hypothetical protein
MWRRTSSLVSSMIRKHFLNIFGQDQYVSRLLVLNIQTMTRDLDLEQGIIVDTVVEGCDEVERLISRTAEKPRTSRDS